MAPLLPIPNRTVKRLSADDSADSRVKVGHRQTAIARRPVAVDGALSFLPIFGWWKRKRKKVLAVQQKAVLQSKASLIAAE